jgi:hypothetical protein
VRPLNLIRPIIDAAIGAPIASVPTPPGSIVSVHATEPSTVATTAAPTTTTTIVPTTTASTAPVSEELRTTFRVG